MDERLKTPAVAQQVGMPYCRQVGGKQDVTVNTEAAARTPSR